MANQILLKETMALLKLCCTLFLIKNTTYTTVSEG